MSRKVALRRPGYKAARLSSIHVLRTRLAHLDVVDWVAIVVFTAAVVGAFLAMRLAHP